MKAIERILVPVDFSDGSKAAVDYAHFLGHSFGAAITLLHDRELPIAISGIVPGADDGGDRPEEARAAELLAGLAERLTALGSTRVSTLVEVGSPIATILRIATEGNFDLIIMGTHGRTGLARFVMGSVSEGVLRRAPCPVLTVHVPLPAA